MDIDEARLTGRESDGVGRNEAKPRERNESGARFGL